MCSGSKRWKKRKANGNKTKKTELKYTNQYGKSMKYDIKDGKDIHAHIQKKKRLKVRVREKIESSEHGCIDDNDNNTRKSYD